MLPFPAGSLRDVRIMMGVFLLKAALAQFSLTLMITAAVFAQTATDSEAASKQHLLLAQQYLRQNRPQMAIPEFQQVVAVDPKDVGAQANLGVLLYFSGKLTEAEPHLRAALELNPALPKIQALLGSCEHRSGQNEAALADLTAVLPHLDDPKVKRQTGLEIVELQTAVGNLSAASVVVTELKTSFPTDPEVLYAAYRTYTDLANEALLDLSVAAPNSGQMHQAMAHELFRERNIKAVIVNLRAAINSDSNLPGVHYELAQALHLSDDAADKADAAHQYELALAQDPHDDKVLSALGDLAAEKGDSALAMERYRMAIHLQPANSEAQIGLAHELVETGALAAALPILQEVIQEDPSNLLAHYRLSALYRRLHRPEDSKREVAAYEHLKEERAKLRSLYDTLRLSPTQDVEASE